MTTHNPYPPPPPRALADMCMVAAWQDDIDDHVRKLLEWAGEMIPQLLDRSVAVSRRLELSEADRENLMTLIDRRLQRGNS